MQHMTNNIIMQLHCILSHYKKHDVLIINKPRKGVFLMSNNYKKSYGNEKEGMKKEGHNANCSCNSCEKGGLKKSTSSSSNKSESGYNQPTNEQKKHGKSSSESSERERTSNRENNYNRKSEDYE